MLVIEQGNKKSVYGWRRIKEQHIIESINEMKIKL